MPSPPRSRLESLLACPSCRGEVGIEGDAASCRACPRRFPVVHGVPWMLPEVGPDDHFGSVHLDVIHYINHHKDPWRLFTRGIEEDALGHIRRGLDRSGRVLDLGGGPGFYADRLRADGKEMVVCDLAKHFVMKGSLLFPQQAYVMGDASALPLREGSFDGVLAFRSLIYLKDLPRVFREVHRVLKPGGQFCMIDRNRWSPLHYWKYRSGAYNATIGEFPLYFTLPRLRGALEEAGFRIERATGDHLCFPGLFPIPSEMRPGLRLSASRLAARLLPRFSFYLIVHAVKPG